MREAAWRRRRRADLRRAVLESALLLTTVVLLIAGLRPLSLAVALLFAGPLVGVAAHLLPAGRALTGLLGALGFAIGVPITFAVGIVGLVLGTAPAFLAFAGFLFQGRVAQGT